MRPFDILKIAAVSMAGVGTALPQAALAATGSSEPIARQELVAPATLDVALDHDGVLRGQVVNPQGAAVKDCPVSLWQQDRMVASTKTDAAGQFAVSNVRSGSHYVVAGEDYAVCRVWTAQAAPRAAQKCALLVSGGQLVRGQGQTSGWRGPTLMLGIVGGVIAAGLTAAADDDPSSP